MIHFVGAGPGATGLITVRGAALLREADVVIYAGSLVNPELLHEIRPDCDVHDSVRMTLPELVDVMRRAHEAGKTVVRLHTGDPSLYGAWKEQADALAAMDIPFDVTPGVSSFCAAAAALKAEYTLPGVSQSLVITRAKGNTDVPEKEALANHAKTGSSMAVFLSAGQAAQVQRELLRGAYTEETPCAVVFRASWEDEKVFRCTLGTLEETVRKAGIDRHALILAGDFLDSAYETSRLYDPSFETAHRKRLSEDPASTAGARGNDIAYLAFTEQGETLAHRICDVLGGTVCSRADGMTADAFAKESFEKHRTTVFVSALGIAVRAVAPYLEGKTKDPAVVVIDEKANHVIPVVSGHLGGANALARRIAAVTGAEAVITTATDVNGVFAADEWARVQGFHVYNPEKIRQVSAKLLAGETVKVYSRFPVEGSMPQGICMTGPQDADVVLDVRADRKDALLLVPKVLVLGCGTKKGIARETIEERFAAFLKKNNVPEKAVACAATIDLKKEEPGLLAFCEAHGFHLRTFSAKELAETEGPFTGSSFVEGQTGVDNVCERSAVLESGGSLVVTKDASDGVTFALAMMPFTADWRVTDA